MSKKDMKREFELIEKAVDIIENKTSKEWSKWVHSLPREELINISEMLGIEYKILRMRTRKAIIDLAKELDLKIVENKEGEKE